MNILHQLNSIPIYVICGSIIAFVAALCVIFMVRAYRAGLAMGMDKAKNEAGHHFQRHLFSAAQCRDFAGCHRLGRKSRYAVAVASLVGHRRPSLRNPGGAGRGRTGRHGGAVGEPDDGLRLFYHRLAHEHLHHVGHDSVGPIQQKYLKKLGSGAKDSAGGAGFGDSAMTAMFIGLVSAYIGSYIGGFVSGNGMFSFAGSFLPLIVVAVSGCVMAGFVYLAEKKNMAWVESFSIACSMLIGMAAAVVVKLFI